MKEVPMAKVATHPPIRNQLLAALPRKECERHDSRLELVPLALKEVLHEPYQPMPYVYFPENGLITKIVTTEDGASVEVGMAGKEGMIGICTFLGSDTAPFKAVVQIPGEAWRMKAAAFRAVVRRNGSWINLLRRYTHAFLSMVSQCAACNLLHRVDERCCRWLLMTHDRLDVDEFPLTQESLALMLGVRRQSISEVARRLSRKGLIRYQWGQLAILNRQGLEAAACECYPLIKQYFRSEKA
jgi:CRP-like cAMP-binding protein